MLQHFSAPGRTCFSLSRRAQLAPQVGEFTAFSKAGLVSPAGKLKHALPSPWLEVIVPKAGLVESNHFGTNMTEESPDAARTRHRCVTEA
jgi:hypothetical protein